MNKRTQQHRILELLRQHEWTSLTRILDLHIASYTRRISELRERGYVIENRKNNEFGSIHSWYKLVSEPSSGKTAIVR